MYVWENYVQEVMWGAAPSSQIGFGIPETTS